MSARMVARFAGDNLLADVKRSGNPALALRDLQGVAVVVCGECYKHFHFGSDSVGTRISIESRGGRAVVFFFPAEDDSRVYVTLYVVGGDAIESEYPLAPCVNVDDLQGKLARWLVKRLDF
jgi:hypothetical protein